MFCEEALWLRVVLASLDIQDRTVLDVGSQTHLFRTVQQPHVDREVFAPLRSRGARVIHLDAQAATGVDIVSDITSEAFSIGEAHHGPFEVVICTNLLEHVTDRPRTIERLEALTAVAGYLIITVPGNFPHHEDPIDTMYRPTRRELARDVSAAAPSLQSVLSKTIPIRDPTWYRSRAARFRRYVPLLRWRTTGVLFERTPRSSAT
jgi:hypothetical protein